MDGFPNFFIAGGPNSYVGHSSVINVTENITNYILKLAGPVLKGDAVCVELKEEAVKKWTEGVQKDMKRTVFEGCMSWYRDESGWNSTLYP